MWPVYVINLDRAAERWQHSEALLRGLGVRHARFAAIDWQQLTDVQLAQSCVTRADWAARAGKLTLPEVACYLSHLALWRKIAAGSDPAAFVLEDDFDCASDVAEVLAAISDRAPDWDMLKLFAERPRLLRRTAPLTGHYFTGTPIVLPMSTLAYAITRQAAVGLAQSLVPFGRPIDIDLKHWWEHKALIKAVTPSPFCRREGHLTSSEIDQARRQFADRSKLSWHARLLRSIVYQFRFYAKMAFHLRQRPTSPRWKPSTP